MIESTNVSNIKPKTALPWSGKRILGALSILLLALTFISQLQWPLLWDRFAISHVVVGSAAATMLTHAFCSEFWRAITSFIAAMASAWLIETIGVATSFPFGAYRYATEITYLQCPRTQLCSDLNRTTHELFAIAGVPVIVLLAWFMMGYAAHITARCMSARPWQRWGWATVMLAAWDLYLDPQFILDPHLAHGWWLWTDPSPALPGVPGIPLTNYLGWLLAAGLIQGVFHAILRPHPLRGSWNVPSVFMVWTWIGGAIAVGWFLNQVPAALWGALAFTPAMVTLLRAHRRSRTKPQVPSPATESSKP